MKMKKETASQFAHMHFILNIVVAAHVGLMK